MLQRMGRHVPGRNVRLVLVMGQECSEKLPVAAKKKTHTTHNVIVEGYLKLFYRWNSGAQKDLLVKTFLKASCKSNEK